MVHVYLIYYNNLVCIVQVLLCSTTILIQDFILAVAAAIHHAPDPVPANVDETEAILDADQPMQQALTEDEDSNEGIVNDRDVIAEVTLPSTIRKFTLFITFPYC